MVAAFVCLVVAQWKMPFTQQAFHFVVVAIMVNSSMNLNLSWRVSAGVRRFGAASLDMAFVAAGRYDGFWERDLAPWDIAAGIILVKEAKGFVSEFDARQNMLKSGDVVCGNEYQHNLLLKTFRDARKRG